MSGNVSQILAESAPANSVYNQSYVSTLRAKWGKMLEGVGTGSRNMEQQKNVMAVLFENQANYMMQLDEETRSTNVGSFLKYVFPVLRRVLTMASTR
jgi:hypothetical protein